MLEIKMDYKSMDLINTMFDRGFKVVHYDADNLECTYANGYIGSIFELRHAQLDPRVEEELHVKANSM